MSSWTKAQDEFMLTTVLEAETKNQYQRALARVADGLEKGEAERHYGSRELRRDGDPVRRRLWGLATRSVEYTGPTLARPSRFGKRWTWAELLVLKWAFADEQPKQAKGKPKPDHAYIANLLYRTEDEVMEKRGITRAGVRGFGVI